jgi:ataxin-3
MNTNKPRFYIYHEQQESALCGQHCLNNLLQGPHFTAIELSDIAQSLDEEERRLQSGVELTPDNFQSSNVDDSGNFSIQVLKNALFRYSECDLVPWHQNPRGNDSQEEMAEAAHLSNNAFIVNRLNHWFTIRKIRNRWWNLNSMNDNPELISDFYLSAFLVQLRAEEFSVFLVKGNIPESGDPEIADSYLRGSAAGATGKWYLEEELLGIVGKSKNSSHNSDSSASMPFQGRGNRLGGVTESGAILNSMEMNDLADYDEELALAQAISASLEQVHPAPNAEIQKPRDPKEEMRAKRLAALADRK